jgi:hypothetical protein
VSEPPHHPVLYRVIYSELVRTELRNSLLPRAKALGLGPETLRALKKLDHILHIYPEYGEPLLQGTTERIQVRVVTVPPLCLLYGLDQDRRLVYVCRPFKLLAPRHS